MKEHSVIARGELLKSVAMILILVLLTSSMAAYVFSDPGITDVLTMVRTVYWLESEYHEVLDSDLLLASARQSIFESLDRYSGHISETRMRQMNEEMDGAYGGIGISVVEHDLGLMIMSVREHGPAAEAGLSCGDIILAADSCPLADLSTEQSSNLLRGTEGTSVTVQILQGGNGDTTNVKLIRQQIDLQHIPYAGLTEDSVIYVRLLDFDAGASDDLQSAVDSLLAIKPDPVGMILDLRGNPGGLYSEAIGTAELFLSDGDFIVGTEGRSIWNCEGHYASGSDILTGLPMVLLVDRGSASSSEIVAGALQQAGRAVLIGDTTFGKGLVQGYFSLPSDEGLRLTISRYYLANGVRFSTPVRDDTSSYAGLAPDHFFDYDQDNAFDRAVENSLLLHEFVSVYSDELAMAIKQDSCDELWVERFAYFALENGFEFQSLATELALEMKVMVSEGQSLQLAESVENLIDLAELDDLRWFQRRQDYLLFRIRQLVTQRVDGMRAMYETVLLPGRPEIDFATSLLRGDSSTVMDGA